MEASPDFTYLEELGLKDKDEAELLDNLLEGNIEWTIEEKLFISSAYSLASSLHEKDRHKERAYKFHLLRVANRVTGYLHVADAEIVAAALLHDSVEDHAEEIVAWAGLEPSRNKQELQRQALAVLSDKFSARTADIVSYVTNPPNNGEQLSRSEGLLKYREKVYQATRPIEGWIVKFADWCDNGVGIVHGEKKHPETLLRFGIKYGMVHPIFERRFMDEDIQQLLDPVAKAYVVKQLWLGQERLETE